MSGTPRKEPEEVSSAWKGFLFFFFKDVLMKGKGSKEGMCCLSIREEQCESVEWLKDYCIENEAALSLQGRRLDNGESKGVG